MEAGKCKVIPGHHTTVDEHGYIWLYGWDQQLTVNQFMPHASLSKVHVLAKPSKATSTLKLYGK